MDIRRASTAFLGGVVLLATGSGSPSTASTPASSGPIASNVLPAAYSSPASLPILGDYSDTEILQLLLAGQGRVVDENPELRSILGFSPDKPNTLDAPLQAVIREYLSKAPDFNSAVSQPLQSGDPERVDEALRYFTKGFVEFAHSSHLVHQGAPSSYARGWTYMGAYVAIYVNALGVANAVAYANVGVATFALATLGVVTFYLDGDNPVTQFEHEQVAAEVARALQLRPVA